jgi:plasmid maintenance system antidote protein VapI
MKDILNIKEVSKIERLDNEHDLQKASLLERKLRLMMDENPDLKPLRQKLRDLIEEYEARVWSNHNNITNAQVVESDKAEEIIAFEQRFIEKRRESIRKKLKEYDITQQDLGAILGHPKSYMSELINGVSQFTLKDLVIIHRVLGISLKTLVPTYLHSDTRDKIRESINKLNNPKLRIRKTQSA